MSPSQVLQDCMRHHSSLVEIGKLWVSPYIFSFFLFLTYFLKTEFQNNAVETYKFVIYWISWKDGFNLYLCSILPCLLLLCSGQPPWQIRTAGGSVYQAALHKNGISCKGKSLPVTCRPTQNFYKIADGKIWGFYTVYWKKALNLQKCTSTAPRNPTKPGGFRWSPGAHCRNWC